MNKIDKPTFKKFLFSAIVLFFSLSAYAADTMSLWPSDCLTKVLRQASPPGDSPGVLKISGARGETVSTQAVFRCFWGIADVNANVTVLNHRSAGYFIPADAAKLQWVRYIDINRNSPGLADDELIAKAPNSIPDAFWEEPNIALKADKAQPVWLEIDIPYDAVPGDYEGRLVVTAGGWSFKLPIELRVWNFEIPKKRHLSIINWATVPGRAFNKRIGKFTEEYWDFLGHFAKFLVRHRQTGLNASLNFIREKKEGQKTIWDTSRLEKYSEILFDAGIDHVHLFRLGKGSAYILDPNCRVAARQDKQFDRLAAFEKVIRRRNWQDRFFISIYDEPFIHHEKTYKQLAERSKKTAPSVRIIEPLETEYLGELDIYVPKLNHLDLWFPQFDRLRNQGEEIWYYTCGQPLGRYPNRFLDQSLLKVRVMHWMNYLYDLKGYLHWALNQFNVDEPYTQDGVSGNLPLGKRAIAYPGKDGWLGSLRYSTHRDGVQDFEYLWVLENELKKLKEKIGTEAFWLDPRQRPLELCKRVIWSFCDYTRDNDVLLQTRKAIAEEIEAFKTEPLLIVQSSPAEGSTVPFGPRHINVRGLVTPGSKVTINGKNIVNVRPSGYFLYAYLNDKNPTITITAEFNGKKRTVKRTFKFID